MDMKAQKVATRPMLSREAREACSHPQSVSIRSNLPGSYEIDGPAAKEHERCGSHLVGPLLVTSALAGAITSRAPARERVSFSSMVP